MIDRASHGFETENSSWLIIYPRKLFDDVMVRISWLNLRAAAWKKDGKRPAQNTAIQLISRPALAAVRKFLNRGLTTGG
jgi:hypothetical protein